MNDTTLSRRERKKQQNQQQILEAALHLFEAQGVEATTIDQIAEAADVSRGTFFNYFPTKESLLNAIAAGELRDLERRGIAASGGSAVMRICALMRALMTDSLAFLQVTRYILLDAMLHPTEATSPSAHLDAILKPLVQQAQAQGEIRADLDPAAVTGALVGVYLGAFFRLIAAEAVVDQAVITAVEATLRLLFEGITGPNYPTTTIRLKTDD
jgi:AcrR family transcriptional regulator